jgi:hypothetical protein
MTFMLTIVSTNERFIQSAQEIFTRYPTTVRITRKWEISENTAYIFPSDAYGNMYSSNAPDGYKTFLQENWGKPRYVTEPIWYISEGRVTIISPCLNLGLFMYRECTKVPYEALRSCLVLIRKLSQQYTITRIVIPALCCEPGGLDPEIPSLQMCQAWGDFMQSKDDIVDKIHL